MNLVIDIGNTSVKLHLFENDQKLSSETVDERNFNVKFKAFRSRE